jgi:hypothetical protein
MFENDVLVPLSSFQSVMLGITAQSVKELIFPQVSYVTKYNGFFSDLSPIYAEALNTVTFTNMFGYPAAQVLLTTGFGKVTAKTTTLTWIRL